MATVGFESVPLLPMILDLHCGVVAVLQKPSVTRGAWTPKFFPGAAASGRRNWRKGGSPLYFPCSNRTAPRRWPVIAGNLFPPQKSCTKALSRETYQNHQSWLVTMDRFGVFVHDVVEREAGEVKPPSASDFDSPATGFPLPKTRRPKVSAFKARLGQATDAVTPKPDAAAKKTAAAAHVANDEFYATERRDIDEENRHRIASMSAEEIEEARRELMKGLSPSILERLMQRASIDDEPTSNSPFAPSPATRIKSPPEISVEDADAPPEPEPPSLSATTKQETSYLPKQPMSRGPNPHPIDEDRAPDHIPETLFPITEQPNAATHFPRAEYDDLDPSDPDFLQSLHTKYFPDLPADPAKLAWMAPIPSEDSAADRESPYHPDQSSLPATALRFDFKGKLVPPRSSRKIPVTAGLHHHGLAPEAAGYTVEELSILARSAVPAQRCISFQTLGRILYRLGKGEWGTGLNDAIAMGVWSSMKQGRVLDTLVDAAGKEDGHRSSQAFALESLWLFEKGGWKEKFSGL